MIHECLLCNLCYEVIVKEFQLIDIEKEFALAQHIPIQDNLSILSLKGSKMDMKYSKPPGLSNQMYQWRVLFHFLRMEDIDPKENEFYGKCNIEYEIFPGNCKNIPFEGFFVANKNTKLHRAQTVTHRRQIKSQGFQSFSDFRVSLNINKLSVHYFFSESKNLNDFFNKCEVNLKIFKHSEKEKQIGKKICTGKFKPLSYFTVNCLEAFGPSYKQIYIKFFSKSMHVYTAICNIGICLDSKIDTTYLNLYNLEGSNVYYTENSYYNCFPFPKEWMELLSKRLSDIDKHSTFRKHNYSPDNNDFSDFLSEDKFKYEPLIKPQEMKLYSRKRFVIVEGFEPDSPINVDLNTDKNRGYSTKIPKKPIMFSNNSFIPLTTRNKINDGLQNDNNNNNNKKGLNQLSKPNFQNHLYVNNSRHLTKNQFEKNRKTHFLIGMKNRNSNEKKSQLKNIIHYTPYKAPIIDTIIEKKNKFENPKVVRSLSPRKTIERDQYQFLKKKPFKRKYNLKKTKTSIYQIYRQSYL